MGQAKWWGWGDEGVAFTHADKPGLAPFLERALGLDVGEAYRGHEGIVRAAKRWIEPFEWLLVELEQIVDADDCIVSIHRTRSKARHSGIEFEAPVAYVWAFQGGKIIHFKSFREPEQALEAAGLSE